ncbi:MAG: formylglycine-generating enzyme family protein [Gemmatimonadetes bacterium]|nr:formylglycine-generating enzyme family protein [Gemmatimonadota bacterium]
MFARNQGILWSVALALGFAAAALPGPGPLVAQEAGGTFRDCEACPLMVIAPGGSFMMGSPSDEEGRFDLEGPQREVTIGSPFAVGVYEVSFEEWDACVNAGGCAGYSPGDEGWGRGRRPVINVSWEDAQTYVQWLSQESGEDYRLLSEAEWEYVARAGTETLRYWSGEQEHCLHANGLDQDLARTSEGRAWMNEYNRLDPAQCTDGYDRTAPVGSYPANAFGLHDVLGNVNEWTQDCWNDSYSGAPDDGRAWMSGDCSTRSLRGGGWLGGARVLRSAFRLGYPAGNRYFLIGLRVARSLE